MFFFITIILLVCILAYFKIANFFNIIDKPNERSSHTSKTIRGAGIIFPIAALLYYFYSGFENHFFTAGLILISFISFLDDIKSVSSIMRFFFQTISVLFLFIQINLYNSTDWPIIIAIYILSIGTINAMNFMDGINGLTGLYSLVTFCTLLYINNTNINFIDNSFILFIISALLVFNFFNVRTKAKCFAGDVGSISIAFIILFALISLIMQTKRMEYFLLMVVYGIDFALTIVHRLIKKENIFHAHRSHLYQYMVHKLNMGHLKVCFIYCLVQVLVNLILIRIIINSRDHIYLSIAVVLFLSIIYIYLKYYSEKNKKIVLLSE